MLPSARSGSVEPKLRSVLLAPSRLLADPASLAFESLLLLQKYSRPKLRFVLVIFAEREGFES